MAQEKLFEEKIKKFLKDCGWWNVKFFANNYTRVGIPDILACIDGQFVAIEVKAQNGTPSELQLYNVQKIRESGGYAMVVYPSAWEDFKGFIHDISTGEALDPHEYELIWR